MTEHRTARRRLLLALGATLGLLSTTTAAHALTPTPYTGTNTTDIDMVTDWGVDVTCEDAVVVGTLDVPINSTPGAPIGTVDDLLAADCRAVSGLFPVVIEMAPGATIEVTAAGSPLEVVIDIAAHVHSTGPAPWACEFRATGNAAATLDETSPGVYDLTFDPGAFSLGIVALDGTGTGTQTPAGTCAGQIYTGDATSLGGAFTLIT